METLGKLWFFFFFSSEKEQSATLLDQKVIKKFSLKNISRRKFLENDRFFNFLKIKTQKSGNWRDRVKKLDFKRHFLSLYKTNLRLFGNKGGEFDFFKKIQSGLKNLNQKNFKIELSLCKKIRSEQRILNFFSGLFVRGINKLNQHKTHPLFDFLLEYSRFTFFKSFFFNYFVDENFSTKLFFKRLLELYLMNFWNSIFNNFLSSSPFRSSLYTFKLNFKFHDSLKKKMELASRYFYIFPTFFKGLKRKESINFPLKSKTLFSKLQFKIIVSQSLYDRNEFFLKKISRKIFRFFFLEISFFIFMHIN